MFSLSTFTERFGAPSDFVFKGQVWDSRMADSTPDNKHCRVCRRKVRYIFILKLVQTADPLANPEVGKLEIGRCCFHYFRKWNVRLHGELLTAVTYEKNRQIAVERDKKRFTEWNALKVQVKMWRTLRRQLQIRLRQLEAMQAVAPVAVVTKAMQAVNQNPQKKHSYWFRDQIKDLRQRIGELSI